MGNADVRLVRGRRMDLEAMDLAETVEPVVDAIYDLLIVPVGDRTRPHAIAKENTGGVCWNRAYYLQFFWLEFLVRRLVELRRRCVSFSSTCFRAREALRGQVVRRTP